ncbi:uncharacterized protein LAESUDRAFT_14154 [Laetiporus sulphureus 93-53]|uniref:Uncharacterized protein n=1 Tax=Laetiporus sulphureus 93-53 TaxID=1314785 RepID=A0A165I8W8_9APHY|nr:uncharacterized protein LAESUDRAFT_14154 [Laetiporus sulphureus 93-53]KZT12745.1 hypothetical protein LAESUDRAFT_14154 [Laetiporus sulphureus 93-53]
MQLGRQLHREQIVRSITAVALATFSAHALTRLVPRSTNTYSLMQSAVAMLMLASMSLLVVTHRRHNGPLLTRAQQETMLVVAFGMVWFGEYVRSACGWRAAIRHEIPLAKAMRSGAGRGRWEPGLTNGWRSYPCGGDAVSCVEEEWIWY